MITKYFQEKEIKAEKAEKEEQLRLRRIASFMAKEVKTFWSNIEKVSITYDFAIVARLGISSKKLAFYFNWFAATSS